MCVCVNAFVYVHVCVYSVVCVFVCVCVHVHVWFVHACVCMVYMYGVHTMKTTLFKVAGYRLNFARNARIP